MVASNMDCLVVGCGLSGAVIARHLADQRKRVVIWERLDHIGGNMYDCLDKHGFLVQKYATNTFRTWKNVHMIAYAGHLQKKYSCIAKYKKFSVRN